MWRTILTTIVVLLLPCAVAAGPSPTAIYAKALPSVAKLDVVLSDGTSASGTGFLALKEGLLVTSWHVVESAASVKARFSNGAQFDTTGVVDFDAPNDVAVLRLRAVGLPRLPLAKAMAKVGSPVYTIGSPNGLDFSITNGIVSQVQTIEGREFYQFTAAISPGSSGSPLLGANGEVLGVVKGNMPNGQSLNFGVPSKCVLALDLTLPTKPWRAVPGNAAAPLSPGIGSSAAGPGEFPVSDAADDDEQTRKMAEFLRQQGFDAAYLGESLFRLTHAGTTFVTRLMTDRGLRRLQFNAFFHAKPVYRHSRILEDFIKQANAKYNFAKLTTDDDGDVQISSTYTFTENLRAKDLRIFLDWFKRSIELFALTSDVSDYLQ